MPLGGPSYDAWDLKDDDPLYDLAVRYDGPTVELFLRAFDLGEDFDPVEVPSRLPDFSVGNGLQLFEAWVPVHIKRGPELILRPFVGRWGVLVYPNSD